MRKRIAVPVAVAMLTTGLIAMPAVDARGPKFSIDIEAFCGYPVAEEIDEYGVVLNSFNDNVAVRLTDVSDDNGPVDPVIGNLRIECLAQTSEKNGPGKPTKNEVMFAGTDIPGPSFGVVDYRCPLGSLPPNATEWKARVTVSGGDLRRPVSDNCEEVPVDEWELTTTEEPVAPQSFTEVVVMEEPQAEGTTEEGTVQ